MCRAPSSRGCAIALVVFVGIALPGRALAISVSPSSIAWEFQVGAGDIVSGTIDFVGMETGIPAGGVVLLGSPQPGDVTLVFTLSNDASSFDQVEVASVNVTAAHPPFPLTGYLPTGDGTIPGPGIDVTLDLAPGYFGLDGVGPGETSDPFFVSFTPSDVEVGDLINFEFVVFDLGTVTIVPEPAALLLQALGLTALFGYSRRRANTVPS